jgi:hypothetical protein
MAHSLNLPYKRNNPRSIRGARRRGWHVVDVDLRKLSGERDVSWMALCIWIDRGPCGYWVASHWLRQFAFESGADAVAFKLKWA